MTLTSRRFRAFAVDAAERAVKTFAQAVLATQFVTEGASLDVFANTQVWSVGAAAAVISVLTSFASREVGAPNDASLV